MRKTALLTEPREGCSRSEVWKRVEKEGKRRPASQAAPTRGLCRRSGLVAPVDARHWDIIGVAAFSIIAQANFDAAPILCLYRHCCFSVGRCRSYSLC